LQDYATELAKNGEMVDGDVMIQKVEKITVSANHLSNILNRLI